MHAQSEVVVYEDSSNYSGKFNQSANEYGDEINLSGTARFVTKFQFEYYGGFTSQGDESARLRFYSNTGPAWMGTKDWITPAATPLFETILPLGTGFNTATVAVPYVQVPDHFTWTIQFFGVTMTAGDTAGLLFYGAATLGKSFNDYWELLPVGWTPERVGGVTNNFAAKVMAVDAAPTAPTLSVGKNGGNLIVSWPATMNGLYLESKPAADTSAWTPVYPQALRVGDIFQASIPIDEGMRIFRLNSQPQPPLTVVAQSDGVHIRWSAAIIGQKLQSEASLSDTAWVDIPTSSRPVGDYFEAVIPTTNGSAFFRLSRAQ